MVKPSEEIDRNLQPFIEYKRLDYLRKAHAKRFLKISIFMFTAAFLVRYRLKLSFTWRYWGTELVPGP